MSGTGTYRYMYWYVPVRTSTENTGTSTTPTLVVTPITERKEIFTPKQILKPLFKKIRLHQMKDPTPPR